MHKCTIKIKSINLAVCLNSLELKTKRLMVTAFVVCSFFLPTGLNDKNSSSELCWPACSKEGES